MSNHYYRTDQQIGKPYRYTECGLDDVYLMNGYSECETPYGKGVSVEDADELHEVIARKLSLSKANLEPKEVRFLRKMMDLTQSELAKLLRCDAQTVARWEKGQTDKIPGAAEIVLRLIYLSHDNKEIDVHKIVADLAELDQSTAVESSTYEKTEDGTWQLAKAA